MELQSSFFFLTIKEELVKKLFIWNINKIKKLIIILKIKKKIYFCTTNEEGFDWLQTSKKKC